MTPELNPSRGPRPRVRALLLSLLALVLSVTVAGPASAATTAAASREYLVAVDARAEAIHVYRTNSLKHTGTLSGVEVGTHAGTIQLPDGRLILVDDKAGEVIAVKINAQGRPKIVDRVKIPGTEWAGAIWAATDAKQRYYAVSGGEEGDTQSVTLVDLKTFAVHHVQISVAPDSAGNISETQVYLAGRPLQLVVTTGGSFQTLPVAGIVAGTTPSVTSTAPLGAGNHGPVAARDGNAVFSTTADGFDGAQITRSTLGASRSVAYSTTRNVVQNYRPRLAVDGRTVWGSAAEDTGLSAADWADTRNNVNVIDTSTFTSALVRLPDGSASRFALSKPYGAVSTIHPDGDALTLVDTQRGSPTYRRVVGTVALPASTGGPQPGVPTTGTQGHFVALNPSGSQAYVTNGGDGIITVVDTSTRRVVRTIDTPTALLGGGYLTVVKKGTPISDLIAR
ncbi:MAG TPA: hypothetical protein VIT20_11805 [Propionibacteriaceae bacterium]